MSFIDLTKYGAENLEVGFSVRRSAAEVNNPLQTWTASLDATDRYGDPVPMATARIIFIPNARFETNVLEMLSDVSDNTRAIATALIVGHSIPKRLFTDGTGLLVVDRIRVAPEYRGHKLGHIIVKAAQDFLLEDGNGLTAITTTSSATTPPDYQPAAETRRHAAKAAKEDDAFWRSMGFKKHHGCLVQTT
jgi:GNAT superfamily N-acetyltransferase